MNNFFKQSLTGLWKIALHDINNTGKFQQIVGHDDIKKIFLKAMLSKRPVHLLLLGPPACGRRFSVLIHLDLKKS